MRIWKPFFAVPLAVGISLSTPGSATLHAAATKASTPPKFAAPPKAPAHKTVSAAATTEAVPALWPFSTFTVDEDELEAAWSWTARLNIAGPFETRVAFQVQDARNYLMLRLSGNGRQMTGQFWRVVNGKIEKLGEPAAGVALTAPAGQLTLQRSAWRIRALWNGRVLVGAASEGGGARFAVAERTAKFVNARMQPVGEPPFMRDDFMRAQGPDDPEVPGQWHRVSGVWKTSGSLNPQADAAMNPNHSSFARRRPKPNQATPNAAQSPLWASGSGATTRFQPPCALTAILAWLHLLPVSRLIGRATVQLSRGLSTFAVAAPASKPAIRFWRLANILS
jgi:hypothetical protein